MSQALAQEPYATDIAPASGGEMGDIVPHASSAKRDQDIEQTRQEILKKLSAYPPLKDTTRLQPDRLKDRYSLRCDQPLPRFSYGNVQAYAVTEDKTSDVKLYAVVCDPARPYRYRALKVLEALEHPHLVRLIDHGVVYVSAARECRYVIVFEQPEGRPLSEILREGRNYNERTFTEQVLKPLGSVLATLDEQGISHCRVCPENVFVGEKVTLGECIGEPSAFSRSFFYEPIERLLTSVQGAGGGTIKTDTFSMGVLAIDSLFSFDRLNLKEVNKDSYTGQVLSNGTYLTLTQGASFSDGFADFLIGTLNDSHEERWSMTQLNLWLGGKRFNLLKPSPPREANRPFEFDGEQFFSPRALAHSFFTKWETARSFVRDAKIDRWVEQALHKRELAEKVRRAINATGGHDSKNPKQNNELLARIIAVLDPVGPIRLEHLAFNAGGIGLLISDAMRNKKQKELGLIRDAIDFDLLNFSAEVQSANSQSDDANDAVWKLQKNRHFLTLKGMGFGMERIMYDLNPNLPCLSSNLLNYHISTLPDMLYALDALAASKAQDLSFTDRHLAAFLASHASVMKEVMIKDLRHHAHLLQSPEVIVMVILAKAQEKSGIKQLKGLCYWAALRMLEMVKNIHSAQTRKMVCRDIATAAEHGHIGYVLQALLNMKVLNGDLMGFEQAQKTFHVNRIQIEELKNPKKTREKSESTGVTIASAISVLMLGVAVYSVMREFM